MSKKRLPLSLLMIRGSIGKQFVIKHYKWGIIKTKYPDMSSIEASAEQRGCRDLFKEAVAYAKALIADPVRKKEWQKKLRRRNGVYNAAVKEFMLKEKQARAGAQVKAQIKIVHKNLNNNIISINEMTNNFQSPSNIQLCQTIKNQKENKTGSG